MTDLEIRQDILDELEFEPSVHAAHIGVAVNNGVATLSGHVSSYAEKIAAERATKRVQGVLGIAEEIEVRYPEDKKSSDDEIVQRAINILAWNVALPASKIKVQVSKGYVTLSGEVDWNYQRIAAANSVRKLSGVIGVANVISVRPSVQSSDIKHRIEDAFKRNAAIDANSITVAVNGGKVTLEGKVHGWQERGAAETAAWSAIGVTDVYDRLLVI